MLCCSVNYSKVSSLKIADYPLCQTPKLKVGPLLDNEYQESDIDLVYDDKIDSLTEFLHLRTKEFGLLKSPNRNNLTIASPIISHSCTMLV